ncbi:dienelactone hydrolase family protein [soil metagenome]
MQNQQDFDSLLGHSLFAGANEGNARRTFIQTAVGAGFAAAALPICAQSVISTDSDGLTAGFVILEINGQQVPVYRAQPAGKNNLPVVLVISEIFGVHEHIADVARRFAKQGYLALAPELFVRQGDAGKYPSIAELIKEVISKVPDAQVMSDLDAVVAWAKTQGGNTDKLAITGFCWGGRITWMYAAHNPLVKTGAAWYGRVTGTPTALSPQNPVDIAARLKAPILGLYGAKDAGITQESLEQMKAALDKAGNKSEIVVYANSGHAFHADYRASYVEADAKDGWQRCLAWFKANLA